jgi:uncharacterized 2Fe-2S/4Fe-4S cluster protein (DUF4445 family)
VSDATNEGPGTSTDTDDANSDTAGGHRVVFTPSGLNGVVPDGTSILAAARDLGVDLDSVCGGRGICGRCQVIPTFGDHPKWSIHATDEHLNSPGPIEDNYRGKRPIEPGARLGCAARVVGDVVIDVPAASQLHRQVVRKEIDLGDLTLDPVVTLHYLQIATQLADSPTNGSGLPNTGAPASEQLAAALAEQWSIAGCTIEPRLLPDLHRLIAAGDVTVARSGKTIRAIWTGFEDRALGVAFDIGSTTVAGHLCDLTTGEVVATAGRMNPQIRFGEDLMSRVSYAMLNDDGAAAMTAAIREALDGLTGELLAEVNAERAQLLELVVVGNPIMHHLVLGIDPTPLGQAPFTLATADAVVATAGSIGIDAPAADLWVAPCIAGHVGADTVAAIGAEGPHRGEAMQLLVDVGTNAEIVLGNRDQLWAASSPTGPAFEGAQISAGQRATTGAIERVRIDRRTLEPRFKIIGTDVWSDEPGFDPGPTGVTGLCGSGVIEAIGELFLCGVIDKQGVLDGAAAARTPRIEPDGRTFRYRLTESITVTQADVRAIQLAKAALRAGIDLLLEHAGIDTVDEVRLAGAFGAHIDPVHAMVLGLIPDCDPANVRAVGNAAGSGAVRALLAADQRSELQAVARSVTKIETATEPRFQELFVAALALPHETAATPNLASIVELPEPAVDRPTGRGRRRRRAAPQSLQSNAEEGRPT